MSPHTGVAPATPGPRAWTTTLGLSPLPWFIWVPLLAFGPGSAGCFLRSYAHLTPAAKQEGSRATLHGALTRHDIFTPRGWHLRLWGWALSGLALLTLAIAGIHAARAP